LAEIWREAIAEVFGGVNPGSARGKRISEADEAGLASATKAEAQRTNYGLQGQSRREPLRWLRSGKTGTYQ
jgi:hypothetical protein